MSFARTAAYEADDSRHHVDEKREIWFTWGQEMAQIMHAIFSDDPTFLSEWPP